MRSVHTRGDSGSCVKMSYYPILDAPLDVQFCRVVVTLAAGVALWACIQAWRKK
jgi:hypothetical protein